MKQEIDSVILHARNAPVDPAKRIIRSNVLDTIDRTFENNSIVFIEGDSLSGKSELAAQFMNRHDGKAIGVFLTTGSPMFYSSSFFRLALCEQIHYLVNRTDSNIDPPVGEDLFHRYVLRLQSLGRRNPITFVIDGLEDSDKADRTTTQEIFSQIPAVQSEFKILITGSDRLYRELNLQKRGAVKIPPFSLSELESEAYLRDLDLSSDDQRALHIYTGGNIGSLHLVRTLLLDGTPIDDLLSEKKGSTGKLLEHEWSSLQLDDETRLLLAMIVFSHAPLSSSALSDLTDQSIDAIDTKLAGFRFVSTAAGLWSVRSEAQKRFIADKLFEMRKSVEDKLINRLFDLQEQRDGIVSLPSQLLAAGQHAEALRILSGEHFSRLLAHESSLRSLNRHAEYGVVSARKGDDTFSELRFSLIQSAINGTTLAATSNYEIEALLSLGKDDGAAALALTAATAEERLRQLAAAAGCFAKKEKAVPEQVIAALKDLLSELEDELSEPLLISIAAELLQVDLDLALQILEKAGRKKSRKLDSSAASQPEGVDGLGSRGQESGESASRTETAADLRPILDAAEFLVKNMSVDDVLDRVSHLEESHKLFLLQRWLEAHRKNPRAFEIALVALDIVLRDTSKAPKLKDLREIAIVVPHISDHPDSDRVISRLDAQSSELVGHGTSEEAVRLKMLLLRGKQRWKTDAVDADLIDLFAQVHGVSDVGIRTACYAWMLYHAGLLRDKDSFEERTGVIAETTKHLLEATDLLLAQTAEHYVAAVDAVRAICMAAPDKALELVGRFNTRARRDKGFAQVVRSLAVNKTYNKHVAIVVAGIESVVDMEEREKLVLFLLYRISRDQKVDQNAPVEPRLLILWKRVMHSTRRMQAMILTYKIINTSASLRKPTTLLEDALNVWRDISDSPLRVNVGYWVVSELAIVDRSNAERWLDMVREESKQSGAPSSMASTQLFLVAGLAGRVFACYVAECPHDFDAALARLSLIVESIPALDEQAQIWAEVGVQLFYSQHRDLSQRVVEKKIEPLLTVNFETNVVLQQTVLFNVAPLLYLISSDAANARIERGIPRETRDDVRDSIAKTILRKMLPSNFYQERHRTEFELSYAGATAVLAQIKLMTEDSVIYNNVSRLCNSLQAKKNRSAIRRNQVADILVDLRKIVEEKLPDKENIQHEGFLIACLAEILRCQIHETKQRNNNQWLDLFNRAKAICNGADRVIVVSMVASCSGGAGPFADGVWFESVKRDIQNIPSDRDRIERYQWVAEVIEPFDKPKCRSLLKEAMKASNHFNDDGLMDKRQRMLDLAHNIDPSFVDEMISILDDDEATDGPKSLLKEHHKLLEARKEAATDVSRLNLQNHSLMDLTEIAMRNVSAMNAGRNYAQQPKLFMELANKSKHFPFPLSYPVWLWIIESALRKSNQKIAHKSLPQLFDNVCSAAEVSVSLLNRSGGGRRSSLLDSAESIVGPGDRERLFVRLRDWLANLNDEQIYISDPYFGPDDLDVIKAIAEYAPNKKIVVLTSKEETNRAIKGASPEEAFRDAWDDMCDGSPPQTDIYVIGYGTEGKHPIHDRWIVSESRGLRLGTSTGSIGGMRLSEISEMDSSQAKEKWSAVTRLLSRETRIWQGQKLHRSSFSL
ncbi:hypothetical protein SAMN05443245_4201 [Paraburkholderia fungorum]|uniref:Uncharacterized protein n=1 Tax=Paraburkholderia fungorum TaxID=134537 RepID=A0A1H1HR21_9BURK|nr:hypothetical protein [Paraburkholderia fungorum]SDR27945.1 hypothetical protein SAMN05443245_4201 [Paraburkholderia fungorum]